jgi:Spy/CpxP family protein refolding chaperone
LILAVSSLAFPVREAWCPRLFSPPVAFGPGEKEIFMCHAFAARRRHRSEFESGESGSHPGHRAWGGFMPPFPGDDFGPGGSFGVRRPLRFLADKLGLDENQIVQLAKILDELKTERAQSAVDERRTLGEFADAFAAEQFDANKAASARDRRVQSNQRLSATVVRSLEQIHAILSPEQRVRLAHLIRAGILVL